MPAKSPSTTTTTKSDQEALEEPLLDPKTMDGPVVHWTVADLLNDQPAKVYLTYHVMSAGFDVFTPLGAGLGGLVYASGWYRPFPTALATMGTAGLIAGAGGLVLGYSGMMAIASKGEAATPIPWTPEGIAQRRDGLRHNFKVRVIDASAWLGVGAAAGALALAGGPVAMGLSPGALGIAQGLSLGSAAGTLGAMGCIYATTPKVEKEEEESK